MKNLICALLILIFFVAAICGQQKNMPVKVYFGSEKFNPNQEYCSNVYPVTRTIPATKAVATAALGELFKGVTADEKADGYYSFSPDETKSILKSIRVKNNAAYVNFNKVVHEKLGIATTTCGGAFFFSSVEKTLRQFPTIKKVFYAIEGDPRDFYDWVQAGRCPKELNNCSGKNF